MRILLIEDEPMYAEVMQYLLASKQVEVDWAASWEEAEQKIVAGANYAAVITDHEFPGGDSFKTVEHVRTKIGGIPIVLLSGKSDVIGNDFLAAGGTKAFYKTEMKAAVAAVLEAA